MPGDTQLWPCHHQCGNAGSHVATTKPCTGHTQGPSHPAPMGAPHPAPAKPGHILPPHHGPAHSPRAPRHHPPITHHPSPPRPRWSPPPLTTHRPHPITHNPLATPCPQPTTHLLPDHLPHPLPATHHPQPPLPHPSPTTITPSPAPVTRTLTPQHPRTWQRITVRPLSPGTALPMALSLGHGAQILLQGGLATFGAPWLLGHLGGGRESPLEEGPAGAGFGCSLSSCIIGAIGFGLAVGTLPALQPGPAPAARGTRGPLRFPITHGCCRSPFVGLQQRRRLGCHWGFLYFHLQDGESPMSHGHRSAHGLGWGPGVVVVGRAPLAGTPNEVHPSRNPCLGAPVHTTLLGHPYVGTPIWVPRFSKHPYWGTPIWALLSGCPHLVGLYLDTPYHVALLGHPYIATPFAHPNLGACIQTAHLGAPAWPPPHPSRPSRQPFLGTLLQAPLFVQGPTPGHPNPAPWGALDNGTQIGGAWLGVPKVGRPAWAA